MAAGKILYLGFESRLDAVLALAVERMTGLRVESGLVQESLFRPAHARMLNAKFPPVELIEANSEPALVQALSRRLERVRPVESRLVRMHDCLWLQHVASSPERSLAGSRFDRRPDLLHSLALTCTLTRPRPAPGSAHLPHPVTIQAGHRSP